MSTPQSDGNTVLFGGFEVDISQFDFNDHSSNVALVKVPCTIFIVLVIFTVALRIIARVKYVKSIFIDDVLIMFAAVFTVALAVTCIVATTHGLGQHIWLLPLATVFDTVKSFILNLFVCQILYACAIALTKVAIISSYFRFIQDKKFHMAMYVTLVPIAGLWATGVFVTLFQCRPLRGAWNFTIERTCIDYVSYLYASSVINVITDIVLCVLPLPYLMKLSMSRKQRIILCVLIGGGASACIVGLVRICYLHQLRVPDTTYHSVPCLILSLSECSLGIISVSIPPIRPLARQLFPAAMRGISFSSSRARTRPIPLSSVTPHTDEVQTKSEEKQDSSASYESSRS